jgi:hypothetical protein
MEPHPGRARATRAPRVGRGATGPAASGKPSDTPSDGQSHDIHQNRSLNITPGGLGIAEGTLGLALVATGLCASHALAAVLLYRLASFWLVALAGWLVLFWLRRPRARRVHHRRGM